jgi:hypothetical protein
MRTRIADTGIKVEDEEIEDIEEEDEEWEEVKEEEAEEDTEIPVAIKTTIATYTFTMSRENESKLFDVIQMDDWVDLTTAAGNQILIRCSQVVMLIIGPEIPWDTEEDGIRIVEVQ